MDREDQRELSEKGDVVVLGVRMNRVVCCVYICAALILGIIAIAIPVRGAHLKVGSEHSGPNQQRGEAYMQSQTKIRLPALSLGGSSLEWYCVNDIVMGGRSSSLLKLTDTGRIQFSGSISTVGGGFASCRTAQATIPVPAEATGILLQVKGKRTHNLKFVMSADTRAEGEVGVVSDWSGFGEKWKVMSSDERQKTLQRVNWQCPITLSGGDALQTVFLPFTDFRPSRFGQKMTGLTLGQQTVYHVGLNAGVFDMKGKPDPRYTDGPFEFEVASISFA